MYRQLAIKVVRFFGLLFLLQENKASMTEQRRNFKVSLLGRKCFQTKIINFCQWDLCEKWWVPFPHLLSKSVKWKEVSLLYKRVPQSEEESCPNKPSFCPKHCPGTKLRSDFVIYIYITNKETWVALFSIFFISFNYLLILICTILSSKRSLSNF